MKIASIIAALSFVLGSNAATIDVRLVISNGSLSLNGGVNLAYKTFSQNTTFQSNSDILIWTANDDVNLRVVNLDSDPHGFVIDNYINYGTIAPGDSAEQNIPLTTSGVFRYYDPLNSPFNAHLGLAGILHVKDASDTTPYFYWGLREHQESWNAQILSGSNPTLTNYDPEHFTVNGNYSPAINSDPLARVTGNVGNEFKVIIVNNGLSIHSLHLHGYHASILDDSKNPSTIGRSKDTFPVYPEEYLVLTCAPDKPGEYPVHDHNLVAVTGGGQYATGMFLTLLIAP